MKKVYLSFPINNYNLQERRSFAERREKALSNFYEVVNPLKNGLPPTAHWRTHMRRDFKLLLDCDVIYMCEGWESSAGCKLEFDVATTCGIEVMYEKDKWKLDR